MKKIVLSLLSSVFLFTACQPKQNLIKIEGNAQGTSYHISYLSNDGINYKKALDSLLKKIDNSMSTWEPNSLISRINNNDSTAIADSYLIDVFRKSLEVSQKTDGAFDVTVGPLINSLGFGYTKKEYVDRSKIDSLLPYVGYQMLSLKGKKIIKAKPQIQLDFNAIAQGYSVDVLAQYLESKGITNYLVEIGGELKTKGKKENNENWKVGIDQPNEKESSERKLEAVVQLNNKALATSGNYRKFYVEGGQKYSHIINPKTGYPAKQNLLSATVIANDCMTADAYATAFMVMGLQESKAFLEQNKELQLEVYFIFDDKGKWKTYTSESLKKSIQEIY